MTRHILDHDAPTDEARAAEFARIEREQGAKGPHSTTAALQRRTDDKADDSARLKAFIRIERT